jgi:hypothetical protein
MNYLDPINMRWEYEERVNWLQRLYGDPETDNLSRVTRFLSRVLLAVGKKLVALGERMQPREALTVATPQYETNEG